MRNPLCWAGHNKKISYAVNSKGQRLVQGAICKRCNYIQHFSIPLSFYENVN